MSDTKVLIEVDEDNARELLDQLREQGVEARIIDQPATRPSVDEIMGQYLECAALITSLTNNHSILEIATLSDELIEEETELRQLIEQALQPVAVSDDADMFWDRNNGWRCFDSIDELVYEAWEEGAKIGAEFNIQRAASMPEIKVRLTWDADTEETCYEIIDAALAEKQNHE